MALNGIEYKPGDNAALIMKMAEELVEIVTRVADGTGSGVVACKMVNNGITLSLTVQ